MANRKISTLGATAIALDGTEQMEIVQSGVSKNATTRLVAGLARLAYVATSTTSLSIGTGAKSLTTQTDLAYQAGSPVRLADEANPTTNYMDGVVSSYSSTTGAMNVTVVSIAGSGTIANWVISLAGGAGPAGDTATITIGTTTTGAAGTEASVVNTGSSSAAVLEFTIPAGADGDGAGDVVGPASATNNSLARFDGTTGKLLKDGAVIGTDVQAHSSVLDGTTASFTTADETKLDGIAAGATANSADATLLDRTNHTGTQAISTVSGLQTALDGKQPLATVLTNTTASFLTAQETKLGYISVTQAVDLDVIESRVNELDASVILKGSWDASAGTFPGSGSAQAGWSYIVSVAGTVDSIAFSINDRIIAIADNASTSTYSANWIKADYTDQVLSVAGRTGAVTIAQADVSGLTTADSPQFTGVNIGHATDTTVTRGAAGEIEVEGSRVWQQGNVGARIDALTTDSAPAGGDFVPTYDTSASAAKKVAMSDIRSEVIVVAVSDESTAITTGTAKVTFRMPFAMTLTSVRASLSTVSSSGNPAIDINEAGASILSTVITIDANEKTSTTAATPAVISDASLADDAEITIDIDTAGTGAKGLKVSLIGYRT